MKENEKEQFSEEEKVKKTVDLLNTIYDRVLKGVPKISDPVDVLAMEYLDKYPDTEKAAKGFMENQVAKCATSGFVTGLGGAITMPITIPAGITNLLYVQMRMIAALAYMGGYEINSDQVRTMVYACLAGVSVRSIFKEAGIDFGKKIAAGCIKKIPGKTLTKINQKIGFRFITKFGEKGIVNIGKLVPGIGGIIGGGFDFVDTRIIAKRAYRIFILGQWEEEPDI